MTNAEWFATAPTELRTRGFAPADAHTTARLLLDWSVGKRHAHLLQPDSLLELAQVERLRRALLEAGNHRPLAYIIGEREFYGRSFLCDERALIPRPETELLVEAALVRLREVPSPLVADLGTGTGCIAITIALELSQACVLATDLSSEARALAQANATRLGTEVTLLPGAPDDWALPLLSHAPFDALLSNPPYIARAELPELQPEIREYEPLLALDGGEDGLAPYRDMAVQCRSLLKPNGFLAAELGAGQWPEVAAVFRVQGWYVLEPLEDLAGHQRVIVAVNPAL